LEKEKKLVTREREILEGNRIPDNTTDFDRMVAGTPNSSTLWIRYISFFLEKNDIEKARAVAERALSETDELLEDMLKRFRHDDLDVWFIYGQHLLETKREQKARELMKKAVNCLPQKYHVSVLSRFAQLEFKYGDLEQSKTIFESILNSQLLERVTALKLSTHKMRLFFKKWMDLEQKFGTEKQQTTVKERAMEYLEDIAGTLTEA
uniref:TPR_REGION domain-containing protein n=1 Tax=Gongylonema pulchrum TaxID=637853 RepID=A0A183EF59_9BILA